MSRVDLEHVSKRYAAVAALHDVSLSFRDGEFFGLLGPSGSGKTTLLRAIAGFVEPDEGSISFDGRRVENVPVHKRQIGMVFQNYALFPNLTVAANIAFGLSVRRVTGAEAGRQVSEMLELVRLTGLNERKPRELSGGQQQRVALARALVTRPKVLLLDEPLGALDRRLRQEMQVELKDIQRETGVTTIFVTHDQEEALTLSDRIAIIDQGRLMQMGQPREIYERPATIFAAQFLGDANIFTGKRENDVLILPGGERIHAPGTAATVVVRPEKMRVFAASRAVPDEASNRIEGHITQAVYSGASVTYHIRVAWRVDRPLLVFAQNLKGEVLTPETSVTVAWSPEHTVPVET
ncbi:MAG TPA: ABC transporter ATP-binding protein [Aestuariivirgaceae bacterium]|nr:ABC transporter ATP-binding protein [Aestuariivirgaceae bacterium]